MYLCQVSGSLTAGDEMSAWSQGMLVKKIPSVPVINSVSVSPQSQGGEARLYFKTDNWELCQVKLIGQNEVIRETRQSAASCQYQEYQESLITFPLSSRPCEDLSVTVRCSNGLSLGEVNTETSQLSLILSYCTRALNTPSLNNSGASICRKK